MLFISSRKLFLLSRYLCFCLDFLVMWKNGLIRKDKINFKIYDFVSWEKNNCNAQMSPELKAIRQINLVLTEYIMKNIFLAKLFTKGGGKTILRYSSKKSKSTISLDQYSKVLHSLFLLYVKLRAIEIYKD